MRWLAKDGWYSYVLAENENITGPWNTEKAAKEAGKENYKLANKLHNAARKVIG